VLEFRIVADAAHDRAAAEQASGPDGLKNPPAGYRWVELDDRYQLARGEGDIVRDEPGPGQKARKHLLVQLDRLNLTEKDLAQIAAVKVERDQLAISLLLKPEGGRKLSQLTRTHLPEKTGAPFDFKYKLAIIIDGVVVSAPYINSEIREAAIIEFGGNAGPEDVEGVIKHIKEAMREPAAGKRSP
jgi:preprotein translocase subunit SecD